MRGRTMVKTKSDDHQHQLWKKGESGFIDGYVRGGNDTPYAVVVIADRIEMIPLNVLEVWYHPQ